MTRNEVIELLNANATEFDFIDWDDVDNSISIEVNDFEGFDEDWSEIIRDYDREVVDKVYDTLKDNCIECIEDFYITFKFEDFEVSWGYASYNI